MSISPSEEALKIESLNRERERFSPTMRDPASDGRTPQNLTQSQRCSLFGSRRGVCVNMLLLFVNVSQSRGRQIDKITNLSHPIFDTVINLRTQLVNTPLYANEFPCYSCPESRASVAESSLV